MSSEYVARLRRKHYTMNGKMDLLYYSIYNMGSKKKKKYLL